MREEHIARRSRKLDRVKNTAYWLASGKLNLLCISD